MIYSIEQLASGSCPVPAAAPAVTAVVYNNANDCEEDCNFCPPATAPTAAIDTANLHREDCRIVLDIQNNTSTTQTVRLRGGQDQFSAYESARGSVLSQAGVVSFGTGLGGDLGAPNALSVGVANLTWGFYPQIFSCLDLTLINGTGIISKRSIVVTRHSNDPSDICENTKRARICPPCPGGDVDDVLTFDVCIFAISAKDEIAFPIYAGERLEIGLRATQTAIDNFKNC